jgi:glycosyltransferase involved in cell wall biosynthesis
MKVLIDFFGPPFFLAHGGAQTQVVETINGLRDLGVEVEFARWWDDKQSGDLIHSFGVPNLTYLQFARAKRLPVVNTTLFTATCNRPSWQLALQGRMISALLKMPGIPPWGAIRSQLIWQAFRNSDLNIVGLAAEVQVLEKVYGVSKEKTATVPLGLAKTFLHAGPGTRDQDYLITTGTITERKRSLELARMAHSAQVPVCFVGKPYDPKGAYWKEFQSLVDGKLVTHIPHTESVDEMVKLLQGSRGYVLYSDYENWCLSAHEAIACGLPILVPDQPWSRELFGTQARYFSGRDHHKNSVVLREFHQQCDSIPSPDIRLFSWQDCAGKLIPLYERVLN